MTGIAPGAVSSNLYNRGINGRGGAVPNPPRWISATPEQVARIGDQIGGRVSLFLYTDDFWRDYGDMRSRGVRFADEPREEPYGTVAVFLDLYGNRWDLLQQRQA